MPVKPSASQILAAVELPLTIAHEMPRKGDAGYPPAPALIDLARALEISTDVLLGVKAPRVERYKEDSETRPCGDDSSMSLRCRSAIRTYDPID